MRFYWQHGGSAAYIEKQPQISQVEQNLNLLPMWRQWASAMMKLYVTDSSRLYRKEA